MPKCSIQQSNRGPSSVIHVTKFFVHVSKLSYYITFLAPPCKKKKTLLPANYITAYSPKILKFLSGTFGISRTKVSLNPTLNTKRSNFQDHLWTKTLCMKHSNGKSPSQLLLDLGMERFKWTANQLPRRHLKHATRVQRFCIYVFTL